MKKAASTVDEFCFANGRLSKSFFYKLVKSGQGPKILKVGNRTLITDEAGAEWRAEMQMRTDMATLEFIKANESKLIHTLVFGKPDLVDRECLSPTDRELLEKVEAKNALLIARDSTCQERITALIEYKRLLTGGV
ncbi:hypothetical protein SAMN04515617_105148 [Collimonas sp. OK242]|uniref:hypothetical protein n=1 Tax=Collimonas sp. OK242 TaxID=1798195 RepID=UPI00089465BB|nr:hypothetical protein [Collimonas sp. OK242]SDX62965.1 hypothetical protein SAMN04515617_105148 [Collimonas sp. OK242]